MHNYIRSWVLVALVGATAFAEKAPVRGLIGFLQNGDYNFLNLEKNETEIYNRYVDMIDERSKEDLKYWKDSLAKLEKGFQDFILGTVMCEKAKGAQIDCLATLSDRSFETQKPVSIAEFRAAVRHYKTQRILFQQQVNNIPSYVSAFPTQINIEQKISATGNVPNYGKVDFKPVVTFYTTQLTDLDATVKNLPHLIAMADGTEMPIAADSGKGLEFTGWQMSPAKIAETEVKLANLRQWAFMRGISPQDLKNAKNPAALVAELEASKATKERLDAFTVTMKTFIHNFLRDYGTKERWRGQLSMREAQARLDRATQIAEAFHARSLARFAYRMPIGCIGIEYRFDPLKLDIFLATNQALTSTIKDPVWDPADLDAQRKSYGAALDRAVERSGQGLFGGDPKLLAKGAALLTWLNGQKELTASLAMVLRLQAADCKEEMIMNEGGPVDKMKAWYQERYFTAETEAEEKEHREYYKNLRDQWLPKTGEAITTNRQSLIGAFQFAQISLREKLRDHAQADELQEQLLLATGLEKYTTQLNDRLDDLFK